MIKKFLILLPIFSLALGGYFWFGNKAEALVITSLSVGSITSNSATISWTTDVKGDGVVEYGANGTITDVQEVTELTTAHSVVLSGLTPATTYTYITSSADENGQVWYAAEGSFTTTSSTTNPPTTTPPPAVTPPPPAPVSPPPPAVTPIPTTTPPVVTAPPVQTSPVASSLDSSYPTGTLVNENGTIYFLMKNDKVKIPFTSAEAFLGLGYKWSNVKNYDISGYRKATSYFISSPKQAHPWGSCLVWKDGTVFYSYSGGLAGIPSMQVAESIGCSQDKIVPLNDADDAVWLKNPKLPVMQMNDGRAM